MSDQYTITTRNCNLEDILHRLFTQLYDDDLLFDLVINRSASEVDITFTTAYSIEKVERVLTGYTLN